ncbi:MAG: cytochrome c oxidase assembly factor Coa1 family protein [Phycisphaeraceae bacterium]
MNDYQDNFEDSLSTPAYGEQQKPRPSWFKRHWLWFVPTIILLPIFCCCGGGGALVWFGISQVFELQPYKDSVAFIEQNQDVQNALGTPLVTPTGFGDLVTMMSNGGEFNINQSGSTMQFDANIPISGPNGTGKLVLDAESSDGGITWVYTVREVHIDQTGEVIDLLQSGSSNTPADASDEVETE